MHDNIPLDRDHSRDHLYTAAENTEADAAYAALMRAAQR